jgi:acetoin utilization deacetylase AcuC-like enzyme
MGRLAYLYDPLFLEHDMGRWHPESPARLRNIQDYLTGQGFFDQVPPQSCPPATREHLQLIHTERYIDFVQEHRGVEHAVLDGGDTLVNSSSVEAALLAAGTAIEAVRLVLEDGYDRVFAATRPPGHHARPDQAMGFCIFNNIALCAAHALQSPEISRVLIVDWDVHHGNGAQEIFYSSDQVFFLSLHQAPFFPRTGTDGETGVGPGYGFTKNYPLLARKNDDQFVGQLERALKDIEPVFQPDLVLISAGFDAHVDDPIGGMRLTDEGFYRMTELVVDVARRHAQGRVISFLEGGYHDTALAKSVHRHLQGLIDF